MKDFTDFLLKNRKEKKIRIVFDIETLQYNEAEGRKKPSLYKNVTYSFAIGYITNDMQVVVKVFPSFYDFANTIIDTFSRWKNSPKIELIAQNTNKYDSHFIRNDLKNFYNPIIKNLFLKNATDEGNIISYKLNSLTKEEKQSIILEKRIKSSNNFELKFFLYGIEFNVLDNFVKTNTSIKTLGNKLLNLGIISEEETKTDFNYTKYNKDYDMTETESYEYARKVFNQLNEEEMTYIKNDIIILANSVIHYSKLFYGFDYDKITFTSNILEYYNDNELTSFQLLKSIGKGKTKQHIKYTNYHFAKENFYDYLKSFYNGGLNAYNDVYVGKILKGKFFSMDINSSYPYVMHNYKIPTYLKDFKEYDISTKVKLPNNEYFYLYRMEKKFFDTEILSKIKSKVLRKMLVKYYSGHDYININSVTIKLIQDICNIKIKNLSLVSWVSFECQFFESRDKISEKYYVKTQGSLNKKVIYKSPYDITITDEENKEVFTQEEIDNSKVVLNGLYGIPALRSHFNIFRWVNDELINVHNGYENNERNIVFSVFVTAVSLYNLLIPFQYLSPSEIDTMFIYCDTDSLYFKESAMKYFPKELFHDYHLGKWGIDCNSILNISIVNHKKYAYEWYSPKENKRKGIKKGKNITVKCGGVPQESFDLDMSFESFIQTQFCEGAEITNKKSIYNKQGTISIYPSVTKLKVGHEYREFSDSLLHEYLREMMLEEIRETHKDGLDDLLYIESSLGTFSESDVYPLRHQVKGKEPLNFLQIDEESIRQIIERKV